MRFRFQPSDKQAAYCQVVINDGHLHQHFHNWRQKVKTSLIFKTGNIYESLDSSYHMTAFEKRPSQLLMRSTLYYSN